jgi:two-component system CheB/CheR fusion protein
MFAPYRTGLVTAKRKTDDETDEGGAQDTSAPLAVVGVAAAAHSLRALERLFAHIPKNTQLAYVIAIRSRDSVDAERVVAVLRDRCGHKAQVARDGAILEKDCIYVGGDDSILTFADRALKVSASLQSPGERGVIDTMLVSLAEHQEHSAIAVVLAGLGSDGVLGVGAVKEAGGLTLAESPPSAGDALLDAIGPAGLVDFLAPVERLPEHILGYARYLNQLMQSSEMDRLKGEAAEQIPRVAALLRNRTGHDFHGYKPNTFLRRIQRRMHVVQASSLETYVERLREDAAEIDHLFQDLLIGVTQFFRDKPEFDLLEREVIPKVFEGKGAADHVRIWVLGCATGEEAYSLAILLRERMADLEVAPQVQIFATDIDGRALALARAGRYAEHIAKAMTPERLARWFTREGNTYCVHKDLREMCIFSAHNVIKDAPFSRIDLISCRNLLIYLNGDLQNRIIPLFHFALKPGGHLFLGPSENVTRHAKLFQPIDRKHRIFGRQETALRAPPEFPLTARSIVTGSLEETRAARPRNLASNIARQGERVAERHAPAYVIVDSEREVLHFSGRTGRYLEPAAGAANLNLLSLVHRDLRLDLRSAIHRVQEDGQPVKLERLRFTSGDETQWVNLIVEPLSGADGGGQLVVLFQDVGPAEPDDVASPPETQRRDEHVLRLEADLRLTKERLQTTIEELESTNEELKSSNEEYQSVNEELQSANEELETSKEELQSVNEELQTVNSELAHRVNELGKANSDLKNLLESTQIATVFLDKELRVRTFTPVTTELFHFLETDIGRPISHITSRLAYPELQDDVMKVLRTLNAVQREVRSPESGATYLVRVLPYRSIDDFIGGAVLTFLDVTAATRAEEALRKSEAHNRLILESATDYAIITTDVAGVVTGWNPGARELLGWTEKEILGRPVDVIFTAEDRETAAPEDERQRAQDSGRAANERWHVRKDGSQFWGAGMLTPMGDRDLNGFLKILRDCTAQRMAEDRQKLLLSELQHRVRNILAVVRSLAARTAASSETLEDFASHFDGRLTTLSRTQNVFARTGDVTVDLEEMVRDELLALAASDEEQVEISGPSIQLREQAAETFALALHELATNAVKYGALATPNGKVSIHWRLLNTKGGQRLALEWRESGVTAVDLKPGRSGFGRELIERGLPYELGAATSLTFEPGGVRALIELPMNEDTAVTTSPTKRRVKP